MTGTNGIDIVFLHELDVKQHIFLCDRSACFRIKFVSIDALENDTFSIQAHDSVFQFKSAESDLGSADLDFISAFVCQNHCKRIEIRYFGTPRLAIFNCPVYGFLFIGFCNDRSIFICQDRFHRTLAHNIQRCREDTVCTVIICNHSHITNMGRRCRIKEYVTENAGESPEILIFQPAGRTSLEHCNSKFVALFTNIWCQFKFRRCKRIFAVADKFAVQPDIHSSFHTLKRNKYTLIFQSIVQVKISDVAANRVVLFRDKRRTEMLLSLPRINGVDVLRLAVSLQFHVPRNLNVVKIVSAVAFFIELLLPFRRILCPRKFPGAVQILNQRGIVCIGFQMVCIDSVVGMCCDSVDCKHFRIGQPVECIFHIVPSILVL